MLAFLAGYVPLHIVMAVIWLSTFVAVTLITAFAARDITGSLLGGIIAVVLVTLSTPFNLGFGATTWEPYLLPRSLALPFLLFAIWKGIRGQPICAATASIPGILVHPSIGLETACLAMAAAAANRLHSWRIRPDLASFQWGRLTLGVLIVSLTSLLWIVPTILSGASFTLGNRLSGTHKCLFPVSASSGPKHLANKRLDSRDGIRGRARHGIIRDVSDDKG